MPAVNLDTLQIVESLAARTAVNLITFTRRNRRLIPFQFFRGNTIVELPAGSTGQLLLKAKANYSGPALAWATSWMQSGSGASAVYIFDFNLNTGALNSQFTAGVGKFAGALELNFTIDGRDQTAQIPAADVINRYLSEAEGIPEEDLPNYPGPSEILVKSGNLAGLADTAAARTNIGAQPVSAVLTSISALGSAADKAIYFTGAGTAAEFSLTAAGRALLDDPDAATQRATLSLGTMSTQDASAVTITGGSVAGITDLAIADGGTGASTAAAAFANLKQSATTTATGVVELATDAEASAGISTSLVITPGNLGVAYPIPNSGVDISGIIYIDSSSRATNIRTGLDKYNPRRPFAGAKAAQDAANGTDEGVELIVVRPGIYTNVAQWLGLGKDYVKWLFMPGVTIALDIDTTGLPAGVLYFLGDAPGGVSTGMGLEVYGSFNLIINDAAETSSVEVIGVYTSHAGSNAFVQCRNVHINAYKSRAVKTIGGYQEIAARSLETILSGELESGYGAMCAGGTQIVRVANRCAGLTAGSYLGNVAGAKQTISGRLYSDIGSGAIIGGSSNNPLLTLKNCHIELGGENDAITALAGNPVVHAEGLHIIGEGAVIDPAVTLIGGYTQHGRQRLSRAVISSSSSTLTLPSTGNVIYWDSNSAGGNVTFTTIVGGVADCEFTFINVDSTRSAIFSDAAAGIVCSPSGDKTIAPGQSCKVLARSFSTISVY